MSRTRLLWWPWASAKHSHNTHVSLTIHYPHHPLFGNTVTVVRRCRSFGLHQVQVILPSGYQLLIPDWMLDEEHCRGMKIVERPTVAVPALLALRSLLQVQALFSTRIGTVRSKASSPGGADFEPNTPGTLNVGDSQQAGSSGASAGAVPGVAKPHAARGRERNQKGER